MMEQLWNGFSGWWATINWGDAPTWVGAVGTTAAVLFGVYTWRAKLRREDLAEFNLVKIQYSVHGNNIQIPVHVRAEAFNSNSHPIPLICLYGWDAGWRPRVMTVSGDVTVPPKTTAVATFNLQRAFRNRDFYVMVQGSRGQERLFSLQGKPLGFAARRVIARQRLRRGWAQLSAWVRGLFPHYLPESRPTNSRRARLGMFWKTFTASGHAAALLIWRFRPYRYLMLTAAGLLAMALIAFVVLGAPAAAGMLFLLLLASTLFGAALCALHTLWRLLDPNRLVLFAPDLGSSLDVIFKSNRRVSFANHARTFRGESAAALREAVATWIDGLEGYWLDIRAQNTRVAHHYMAQLPQLKIVGRDWTGHYRLAALPSETSGT
ncbi:hypothetical protein [Microbacterium sp. NPDC090003]|uniref:hypothetical protein n=1 Tax=Microbacterium sp. NPDC090003 TaxID=3364203 RepID=UPI00382D24EA